MSNCIGSPGKNCWPECWPAYKLTPWFSLLKCVLNFSTYTRVCVIRYIVARRNTTRVAHVRAPQVSKPLLLAQISEGRCGWSFSWGRKHETLRGLHRLDGRSWREINKRMNTNRRTSPSHKPLLSLCSSGLIRFLVKLNAKARTETGT